MTTLRPSVLLGSVSGGRSPKGQHRLRYGGAFVVGGKPAWMAWP